MLIQVSTPLSSRIPDTNVTTITTALARSRIAHDEDFVYSKRFDYSLTKLLERYPDGVPDRVLAAALMIVEEDIEVHYQRIVRTLRTAMGVDVEV